MSPTKQMSAVGLLRHDEATGTITLDIRNVPNGDPGLSQEDERGTSGGEEHVVIGTLSSAHAQSGTAPRFQQPLVFTRMSFCETMCVLWSALYMVCVVVVGLMVPIAEIFVGEAVPVLFEGYYIYMYVVSISFLAYVYSYVLRMRTMPRKMHSRTIVSSVPVARKRGTVANAGRQTGSFYLRLGAVVFGITSMIKSGLHFGEYFEMTSSRNCDHVLYGIRPIVHLCFTFAQLYFVFLNSQMMTRCYGYLARFGLMHMVATNVAVWLQEVVRETLRELGRSGGSWNNYRNDSGASYDQVSQPLTGPTCQGDSLMGDVVVTSSPYLYPCSVMYSLICAAVLFVMWLRLNDKINTSEAGDQQSSKSSERSNVDCSSSSRGLFLGIIIFVAAVIILITFFVLVQTDQYINTAVRLDHLGDVALYVVTIVAVILVFYRTFGLRYSDQETGPGFEDALLVLSLLGVYVLCVSNVLAAVLATDARSSHLVILSNCLRAFQASLQTAYLLNTLRRRVWRQGQAENKSGREFVTFLLLSNVALWGMSVFEVQRAEANPLQANFYGHVTWNVITHVSLPLAIMFRFHSTVCLANIWKHAWRLKG
ncbi:proton channel OtopLc-like [Dreissena polymorpha]|nr:proton channel OtopLc-like [Dreissena polymorpha]